MTNLPNQTASAAEQGNGAGEGHGTPVMPEGRETKSVSAPAVVDASGRHDDQDKSPAGRDPSPAGASSVIKLRRAQREFMRGTSLHRLSAFSARRQFGKTTTFGAIALKKMMKQAGHTVIFGSAKLNLSREIVRKEADVMQRTIQALQAQAGEHPVAVADAATGKIPDQLTADDFADLFEAQRLEFRFYHSRSVYSRTKVVALRPDTVGETGDLMADEIGRIGNWREVWEAIEPIVASDPTFRVTLATTPPPDDTHFSFEMLTPPIGTDFPVNPNGNWYRSEMGVWVLRVDAFDAWADGIPVYDLDNGEPLPPEEHRRRAHDKDAWDRNYGVKFVFGGTGACSMVALDFAQRAGVNKCAHIRLDNDTDLDRAIAFLLAHLTDGPVGLGWDLATTEKATSNPSALTVLERVGLDRVARLILSWKTDDPDRAEEIVTRIVNGVAMRKEGGRPRRLCIDATNERYFAQSMRKALAATVPVELVIGSETVEVPGEQDPITKKQLLGGKLVEVLEDAHLILPPERYIKEDFRLVKKKRGTFDNEVAPDGKHGDTFDSTKLAEHALTSGAGGITSVAGIKQGNNTNTPRFRPRQFQA